MRPEPVSGGVVPSRPNLLRLAQLRGPVYLVGVPVPCVRGPVARVGFPVTRVGVPVIHGGFPVIHGGLPVSRVGVPVIGLKLPLVVLGLPVTRLRRPVTLLRHPVAGLLLPVASVRHPVTHLWQPIETSVMAQLLSNVAKGTTRDVDFRLPRGAPHGKTYGITDDTLSSKTTSSPTQTSPTDVRNPTDDPAFPQTKRPQDVSSVGGRRDGRAGGRTNITDIIRTITSRAGGRERRARIFVQAKGVDNKAFEITEWEDEGLCA